MRVLIWSMYVVLLLGAVTMVYPFALMIAGSTKSDIDTPDAEIIPRFLVDDDALYRKHVEGLFNESIGAAQRDYNVDIPHFKKLPTPTAVNTEFVADWKEFLAGANLPFYCSELSYMCAPRSRRVVPLRLRQFRKIMEEKFDGDLGAFNDAMGTELVDWSSFRVQPMSLLSRMDKAGQEPLEIEARKFRERHPPEECYYFSIEGFYKVAFLKTQYTRDIAVYNEAHNTSFNSWDEVHLDRRILLMDGRTELERKDWEEFVRTIVSLFWIRSDEEATPLYRRFLNAKYGEIDALNRNYRTDYADFDRIPCITGEPPLQGLVLSDWAAFIQGWRDPVTGEEHQLPIEMISIHSVDFLFRDFMKKKYETPAEANRFLGTAFTTWLDVLPPQRDMHFQAFIRNKDALKWEFVRRNYISVANYIILHGRGIVNTAIYCSLAIVLALLVNPLAAYALSRYRPPSAYKVLLFLMLTMAFPPMVTQIPVFLMLREFNLLNTFWALVLPGMANGYSIFLLKGFFDSLPQELYESAEIDGAGEFRIFWQITMSLSTPILAVIALQAFNMAYANFMMALLICQDQKMWTLMPWLYQLQQDGSQGITYAALLIAAIPTFIIFVFCQNIIMRGIVVPVEK